MVLFRAKQYEWASLIYNGLVRTTVAVFNDDLTQNFVEEVAQNNPISTVG